MRDATMNRQVRSRLAAALCSIGIAAGCSSGTAPVSPERPAIARAPAGDLRSDPSSRPAPSAPTREPYDPVDPFVVLIEVSEPLTDADLESMGAVLLAAYPEIHVLKVVSSSGTPSESFADLLSDDPRVLSAQPDRLLQNPESRGMVLSFLRHEDFVGQAFLERVRAREAHAISSGEGAVVAVLDTGIDPGHPDLAGRYRGGFDLIDRDTQPWEVANGIDDDADGLTDEAYGHGTHVAGLVALLAPSAGILAYRVQDSEGWGTASDVVEGTLTAVRDGADVINLSLGMYTPFRALELAVTYAIGRGIPVFASAGNDGWETPVQYPAGYDVVVAVASVDSLDRLSVFSSYGEHIDLAAPGESILSTIPGGGYAAWSGTSMSAPMAGALCALLRSRWPGLGVDDLREILARSTAPGTAAPGLTGHGRIDFLRALDPPATTGPSDERIRIDQGG
jgi:subtilisin family serine protease